MLKFRSVRSRLAFYFLGFVSLVQIVVFVALDVANQRVAREQLETVLGDARLSEMFVPYHSGSPRFWDVVRSVVPEVERARGTLRSATSTGNRRASRAGRQLRPG